MSMKRALDFKTLSHFGMCFACTLPVTSKSHCTLVFAGPGFMLIFHACMLKITTLTMRLLQLPPMDQLQFSVEESCARTSPTWHDAELLGELSFL